MRRENEQLRARLVDTERDYIRVTRLNEIYREELIEHRRRVSSHLVQSTSWPPLRTGHESYMFLSSAWLARRQPHWFGIPRPLLTAYSSPGIIVYIFPIHIGSHQPQSPAHA